VNETRADSIPSSHGGIRAAAARGMLWLGAGRLSGQALDQLFALALARLLTPADFGLFALGSVFTSLFRIFAGMGFGRAIVQRAHVDNEYLSTAFWSNLAAGVVLFGVSIAAGEVIAIIAGTPAVVPVVIALSTRFIFAAGVVVQMAVLSRQMEFRSIAGRELLGAAAGGVVGVSIALAGGGVWSLVGQAVAMTGASTVLLWWAVPWRPAPVFSRAKFQDMWAFGWRVLASRSLQYLSRNMDNLLVGRFLGSAMLGYYALAYRILIFPLADVGVIVNRVAFAALSRLNEDRERLRDGYLEATRYVTLVIAPMMAGLALVAPWFLEAVFSPQWLPATTVLRILAVAGIAQGVVSIWPLVMQAAGRPELQLRWTLVAVCAYLPAFALGLRWGIEGVAAGYLVVTVLLTPLQMLYLRRIVPIRLAHVARALRPAMLGVGVMVAGMLPILRALAGTTWPVLIEFVILVGSGIVFYGATVWLTARREVLALLRARSTRTESRRSRRQQRLAAAEELTP
jgi:O-antigen/teichoic acid export membrane protein